MTGREQADPPAFEAYTGLLRTFLARRAPVVEQIQDLLNAWKDQSPVPQDRPRLAGLIEDFFFRAPGDGRASLRGRLREAHRAGGFRPSDIPGLHNDLVDPAQMLIRGVQVWQRTRWPGRSGRMRFAHTLFNLYLLRDLELLVMRIWDDGSPAASERLSQVQSLLDELWQSGPPDQPRLMRDARWLIPMAQSPANAELAPYFLVAERVAASLPLARRLEIHRAGVVLAGGHLRSQLRYYAMHEGATLDDRNRILSTRRSNALDFALMVQDLVPLLTAYEQAITGADGRARLGLADVICQGVSADPDLFVNRMDLLGGYSMVETLFASRPEATAGTTAAVAGRQGETGSAPEHRDGPVSLTSMGCRHLGLLREYQVLMDRLAGPLHEDCVRFRPVAGSYSPYGAIYGFTYNLTEHMALKTLLPDASPPFSLEDAFTAGGPDKLAWVNGWRRLPHISPEVLAQYQYPQAFADGVFDRMERVLRRRARGDAARSGRLFIVPAHDVAGVGPGPGARSARCAAMDASPSPLEARYYQSSDSQVVAAGKAGPYEESLLLHDRDEGMYAVSWRTAGGWTGLSKDVFTAVLGEGRDAAVAGLPAEAAAVLGLMCPALTG